MHIHIMHACICIYAHTELHMNIVNCVVILYMLEIDHTIRAMTTLIVPSNIPICMVCSLFLQCMNHYIQLDI